MKLGMVIPQTDPETVFNALRLALYRLKQGDTVRIFLSGRAAATLSTLDDRRSLVFSVQRAD